MCISDSTHACRCVEVILTGVSNQQKEVRQLVVPLALKLEPYLRPLLLLLSYYSVQLSLNYPKPRLSG